MQSSIEANNHYLQQFCATYCEHFRFNLPLNPETSKFMEISRYSSKQDKNWASAHTHRAGA